ncbi:thermonuclease family protein [Kiritimatiellota bacterium B12222]|nr:thermonuclease family protein [Kiritimatiellota bacterium B12222]
MNPRKKNQLIVTAFFLFMFVFTGLMTFYVGPIMIEKRMEAEEDKILFKCQKVVDGNHIEVQLRDWEIPNPNPVIQIQIAGLNVPPLGNAEDEAVIAWASANGVSPEIAAEFGESTYKTLIAFIRKQNLLLYSENGEQAPADIEANSPMHVIVAGAHVNLKLLRSGLALHDSSRPHAYADKYANAQAEAQAGHKGLWQYLPQK